jgi:hypothetical protein
VLLCALQFPPHVKSKPRLPLSLSELLEYSGEHKKLIVELDEAVRELSALLREINLLLASQERQKHYQ